MTRVLAELLEAREPLFHQSLSRLESASGHTSADIYVTTEIQHATKAKLRELGLDPNDTTGEELYAALGQRLATDNAQLLKHLAATYGHDTALSERIAHAVAALPLQRSCFALKTVIGRKLLKKTPPKATMKLLGYRSVDSLLRREQLVAVLALAWTLEPAAWRKAMLESYKKLHAADFEIRPLAVIAPTSAHWQDAARHTALQNKQMVLALREYAAIIILPFPEHAPEAAAMATLALTLHTFNAIRASSTYLKLYQVRPDFGTHVMTIAKGEPTLQTSLLDGQIPWHIIQRYYARYGDRFRDDLFAPHIQREDMTWHSLEKAISLIHPSLHFWQRTASLGMVDHGHPVSMNVIDAALNHCNAHSYQQRIAQYLKHNIWSELLIRYLKHDNVEQALLANVETNLAGDAALLYS